MGGSKLMSVPFFKPSIGNEEIESVAEVLRSGWLTKGRLTEKFEESCKSFLSASDCLAVSSGTAGLHLALLSLGLKPGDEVITTSLTHVATVQAILYVGAKPVFADIDPETMNLSPQEVLKRITRKTKAILPVHFAGHPCDMDEFKNIAKDYNIRIVEDAAHAFGASYNGRMIGSDSLSDITVFSFYPNKPITTGEGGLVCGSKEVIGRLRVISHHGIVYPINGRLWKYDALELGYKYNFTDIQAAIGLVQLSKAKDLLLKRKKWFELYNEAFKDEEALIKPVVKKYAFPSYYIYPLRLNLEALRCSRDEFALSLEKEGVGISVHYSPPVHLHSYYLRTLGVKESFLPITEEASKSEISLPLYPDMTEEEFDFVVDKVFKLLKVFKR
ncbi:MAG: DegT/DnrJ/EryC1/StrS aminotransferase family protein [Synergistetes bacterium]|nr:DegT/DnrJ/EryC1/StrS aminotransferase family protein [Synergistota bacterium]MCX8128368.1 DegT/DnrJ/EryC1/StrS aminotransferase family protein [Synergistota bacterium]MDW8192974.1 DegT/DnrJ/EryC1/StrS aminotransferase family protein [Synergistota bacterium]